MIETVCAVFACKYLAAHAAALAAHMHAAHGAVAATGTAGAVHLPLGGVSVKASTAVGASLVLSISLKYGKRHKKIERRVEVPASAMEKVRACLGRALSRLSLPYREDLVHAFTSGYS